MTFKEAMGALETVDSLISGFNLEETRLRMRASRQTDYDRRRSLENQADGCSATVERLQLVRAIVAQALRSARRRTTATR